MRPATACTPIGFFASRSTFATDGPELKRLLARLAQHFHADPAVAELARVMRIPGSFNFKDQDEDEHAPPIKVGIEHIDAERRYNIADFDEILPTVAARPTPATAVPLSPGDPIRKGQRNIELHRVGRKLRAAGLSPAAIEAALRATPCQPPLPPAEIDALVKQVLTQKDRPDYQGGGGDDVILDADVKVPVVTQLSTVTALPIDWIWKGNLARGKKTLVAGNPGEGKTTITLDVTARVTTGRTMPDGTPGQLGNVLILTAEDDLADTVRPRVDQLDGEPRRVFALEAVRDAHGDRPLNLARDLDMLVEAMAQVKPVLVIIDPISAYLGRTDSYKDAEVRGLLAPLAAVLREHHAALIAIAHLTKDQQKAALHRPGGSVAFVAAARLVFAVGTDPSDETRQILAPLKTNICTKPPSLAYRIDEAGRITWDAEPVVGLDAEALLSVASSETRTELADADAFLREVLEDGPMKQSAVAKLARSQGFADRTLRRARERIGVETSKQGFSGDSFWIWSLPPIHTEVGHLRDETGKTPNELRRGSKAPPSPESGQLRSDTGDLQTPKVAKPSDGEHAEIGKNPNESTKAPKVAKPVGGPLRENPNESTKVPKVANVCVGGDGAERPATEPGPTSSLLPQFARDDDPALSSPTVVDPADDRTTPTDAQPEDAPDDWEGVA